MKNLNSISLLADKALIILLSGLLLSLPSQAAAPLEREYKIKASFMSNFIKYAHWHNMPKDTFSFCTTNQRINKIFQLRLAQERWHNRIPHFDVVTPGNEFNCQLLFIAREQDQKWVDYLKTKPLTNILLIGERLGFAHQIGHINFLVISNKLHFQINSQRLINAKINLSSSLLRLARIVDSEGIQ